MRRVVNTTAATQTDAKGNGDDGNGPSPLVRDWSNPTLEPVLSALQDCPCSITLLASKRRGAKSFTLRAILHQLLRRRLIRMDSVVVVSGTNELNAAYSSILPQSQIMTEASEVKLQALVDWQQQRVLDARARARKTGKSQLIRPLVLILDDIASSIDLMRSKAWNWICLNGRHASMTVFLCSQTTRGMFGPSTRANIDFILAGTLSHNQLRSLWECTCGMTYQQFLRTNALQPPHSFLFYSQVAQRPDQRWALIKAPGESGLQKFRIGKAPSTKDVAAREERARLRLKQRGDEAATKPVVRGRRKRGGK
jgi:hypothetical protein